MECNKKQNGSLEERDEVVSQNLEIWAWDVKKKIKMRDKS
jgi:hypothetical protein